MKAQGLTLGEAAVGGALLMLAAVAWSSLVLATFGRHSLLAVLLSTVALLLPLALSLRRCRLRVVGAEGFCLAALASLSLWFYLPGWPRAFGDLDPGVYLAHGAHIARSGALAIDDPVVDPALDLPWADAAGRLKGGTRFPGYYVQPQHPRRVVPQFFALYPALLGTAGAAFGGAALPHVNPVIATLSVLLLFLVLQRALGRAAAVVGAGLLALNVVQVYYARYPDSEMLAQALVLAAVLGVQVAGQEDARVPAFLAGACVALTFLARPEGVVAVLLGGVGLATAVAGRGRERMALAFGLGLLVPLPHALLQAYHLDLCGLYSRQNGLPGPQTVGLLFALTIGAGMLLRLSREGSPQERKSSGARAAPWVAVVAVTSLLVLGALGPFVFAPVVSARGRALWTELGVWRLALLVSPIGLGLAWIGALRACLGRWHPRRLVPLLPLTFLPLVFFQAQLANPYLLPWSRRLVVYVLPGCFFLVGSAAALGFSRRRRGARAAASAGVLAALLWSLYLTVPLLSHVEGQGSMVPIDTLGHLVPGRRALVLFLPGARNPAALALGGPVWSWHDQTTAVLPERAGPEEVMRFLKAFPDQPAFLVTSGPPPPALRPFVRGLDRALVARVPHVGLSRLTTLVVDESFPVLVYPLGPALSCAGEACYGEPASREVPLR